MALPIFGVFKKAPRDFSMWTNYPVKLTEPVRLDPFIEVNLDHGPVTIGDLTFSTSDLEPVRLSTGYGPVPKETINLTPSRETVENLRNLLKSNDGGTLELVWGPDIFYNWVRIDCMGSKHSNLIPLSRENHSRSEFIEETNKQYGSLPKKFYHIKYENTSNLWVQIGFVEPPKRDLFISQEAIEFIGGEA
jgi:hypothetical protein